MSHLDEKIEGLLSAISNLKKANLIIIKELNTLSDKVLELKSDLASGEMLGQKVDPLAPSPAKRNPPVVRRADDESGSSPPDDSQIKYDIHVVGLGTVKVDF
jgi:hypothetical protein